jgi:hypothetical protein
VAPRRRTHRRESEKQAAASANKIVRCIETRAPTEVWTVGALAVRGTPIFVFVTRDKNERFLCDIEQARVEFNDTLRAQNALGAAAGKYAGRYSHFVTHVRRKISIVWRDSNACATRIGTTEIRPRPPGCC